MIEQTFLQRIQKTVDGLQEERQQLLEAANMQIAELNGRIAALSELLASELLAEEMDDEEKDED